MRLHISNLPRARTWKNATPDLVMSDLSNPQRPASPGFDFSSGRESPVTFSQIKYQLELKVPGAGEKTIRDQEKGEEAKASS